MIETIIWNFSVDQSASVSKLVIVMAVQTGVNGTIFRNIFIATRKLWFCENFEIFKNFTLVIRAPNELNSRINFWDYRIGKMEPLYDLITILNFENHLNFYITGWLMIWTVFGPYRSQKWPFGLFIAGSKCLQLPRKGLFQTLGPKVRPP